MIRTIGDDEIEQSLALTQAAYAIRFTEAELRQRRDAMKMNEYLGFYTDGGLSAQLAILPLRIYMQGAEMAMGGIAHVASYPELRRQGMVGQLLVRSLETMRDAGQAVSMLHPFAYSFYRKFGWDYFSLQKTYALDMAAVPRHADAEGRVGRMSASDWPIARSIYDRYAKRYNGMLLRDGDWWTQQVFKRKLGHLAVGFGTDGEPVAYMLYDVKDKTMHIHEFVCLDEAGRRLLWSFVANHDSIAFGVRFKAPADDPFQLTMAEPAAEQMLHPNAMLRVVDVGAFARQYRFRPAANAETALLRIRLTDERASWNSGLWTIEVSGDGSADARRTDSDDPDAVECDIRTFSTMMAGCQRPSQLAGLGRLIGPAAEIALWELHLPPRIPFLTDFF